MNLLIFHIKRGTLLEASFRLYSGMQVSLDPFFRELPQLLSCLASLVLSCFKWMQGRYFLLVPEGVCKYFLCISHKCASHWGSTYKYLARKADVIWSICHGIFPVCRHCLVHGHGGWRVAFHLVRMSEVLGVLVEFCSVSQQRTGSSRSSHMCIFIFL